MDLTNPIFDDGVLHFPGDPLLVVLIPNKNASEINRELSGMDKQTQDTNIENELHTTLDFDHLTQATIDSMHIYILKFDDSTVDLNYMATDYNEEIVSLVICDILSEYKWLALPGCLREKDSQIYGINQSQVILINNKLYMKSSHPLSLRLTLELVV